jgi:predicted 3-demethylubiquinone-9 3-methyltransferase (glyoxalase superfamily)
MTTMPNITPHLWYDKEASEAAEFYVSSFGDSRIKTRSVLRDTPSGAVEILTIDLMGQEFVLISAGPYFRFTPAVSFLVACTSPKQVDALWDTLSPGGSVMMKLDRYPFSERYGWLQDRYGLSWQIMEMGNIGFTSRIIPTLMFTGEQCGSAEAAVRFYASIFPHASIGDVLHYTRGEEPDKEGTVKHVGFLIEGQAFAAMDSARVHGITFNEAISFIVHCQTQDEIDYYWNKLSAVPEAEQCGWLKDRYGVSWQIVPAVMNEMMNTGDPQKLARVTKAFLAMKKFDIAKLQKAFDEPQ